MTIGNIGNTLKNVPIQKNDNVDQTENTEKSYDRTQIKKDLNTSIIESQINISASNGDESMTLLYKTALQAINKELEPTLGKGAIKKSFDEQIDVSPKATAERIVQGAVAFLGAFKEQNSDLSDEEVINKFIEVIGSGIDKGFEGARETLEGLSVLEGDVANNIDLTYDLVQEGLKDFSKQFIENMNDKSEEAIEQSDEAALETTNNDG